MYVSPLVDVPNDVLEALERKELVIFAGAGVSMPFPSNLPSFSGLADMIGEMSSSPRNRHEQVDAYLGRLIRQGVAVHDMVAQILGNDRSLPSPLHKAIASIFRNKDSLRIVTTNFDRHFSTVAREIFGENLDTYYAPALPLGDDFNGLVYLHGQLDRSPKSMILTDRDLSQAYLTSAWATRFLLSMFTKYTVVFIGYSHQDPLMAYLARGLATHHKSNRYVFTLPGQDDFWASLGITPIPYPKKRKPATHKALQDALTGWVSLTHMGVLDHEDRIKTMVSGDPPLDLESVNYLEHAVADPIKVRSFRRHAKGLQWLNWITDKPSFEQLFGTSGQGDVINELAAWVTDNFLIEHPDELLRVVQQNHLTIHPQLWNCIAATIARTAVPSEVLSKWVPVLISTTGSGCVTDFLKYILSRHKNNTDCLAPVQLFQFLTRPQIKLERMYGWGGSSEKVRPGIGFLGDHHWLKSAWNGLKQQIDRYHSMLLPVLTNHIMSAHSMLRDYGVANDYSDPISFLRSAIEPHSQDRYPKEIDVLIDATRDIVDWLCTNRPSYALELIKEWIETHIQLLMRIAVHGMTSIDLLTVGQKLRWMADQRLIHYPGLKHEVFRLMAIAYRDANDLDREAFLTEALNQSVVDFVPSVSHDLIAYEQYNMLVWLKQTAPDCSRLEKYLTELQSEHPNFAKRAHPDFDHYTYGPEFVKEKFAMTVDELVATPLDQTFDLLLTYQGDSFAGDGRYGCLDAVTQAAARSFSWGMGLVEALQQHEAWESDLWHAVLRAWEGITMTPDQWFLFFDVIHCHRSLKWVVDSVSSILDSAARRDVDLPVELWDKAEELALLLFKINLEDNEDEGDNNDWFTAAINRPGGKLTEFMMQTLSLRRKSATNWNGLTDTHRKYVDIAVSDSQYSAQLARVMLAFQTFFLFSVDRAWTEEKLLPLFGWSGDSKRTCQIWQGFLHSAHWNEALLDQLMPHIEASFYQLNSGLAQMTDRFTEFLAVIALYSSVNPIERGWLTRFIKQADQDVRGNFSRHIGDLIEQMEDGDVDQLWDRWLKKYLANRVQGIPVGFCKGELEHTWEIAPDIGQAFPEFVGIMCRVPGPSLEHTRLYYKLEEKGTARHYPAAVEKMLLHILPCAYQRFYHCDAAAKVVDQLIEANSHSPAIDGILDYLADLYCDESLQLRSRLQRERQNGGASGIGI